MAGAGLPRRRSRALAAQVAALRRVDRSRVVPHRLPVYRRAPGSLRAQPERADAPRQRPHRAPRLAPGAGRGRARRAAHRRPRRRPLPARARRRGGRGPRLARARLGRRGAGAVGARRGLRRGDRGARRARAGLRVLLHPRRAAGAGDGAARRVGPRAALSRHLPRADARTSARPAGPPAAARRCACACRRSRCASRICCTASRSSTWRPAATSRCGARTALHAYALATVVDDAASGITDVLRGDDLLAPTGRQVLLQRLLGVPTPTLLPRAPAVRRRRRPAGQAPRRRRGARPAGRGRAGGGGHGLARRDRRPRRARRAAAAGGAGRPLRRRGACTAPRRRSTRQTSRSSTAPRGDERVDLDG